MRGWRLQKGLVAVFLLCSGLIGLMETEVFAVAGKVVHAPAAASLAGTEVKFELEDGGSFTTVVNQDGTFNAPQEVNKDSVAKCYRKQVNATTGKMEWAEIKCGWFLFGGGAAATGTAMTSSADAMSRSWGFDVTLAAVYGFGVNNSQTQTQASGFPAAQTGTGDGGRLESPGVAFTLRAIAPFEGALRTRYWGYMGFEQYSDASGTGGQARNHLGVSNDTESTRDFNHAFKFGLGVDLPVHCPTEGWGKGCTYIGVRAGGAVVQQTSTVTSDESSGGGGLVRGSNRETHVVPNLGIWGATPIPGTPFEFVLGLDAVRLASIESRAQSQTFGFQYQGRSDSMWYLSVWAGPKYTF